MTRLRPLFICLWLLVAALSASAQTTTDPRKAPTSITGNSQSVSLTALPGGRGSGRFQVTGTFTMTLTPEVTVDGTNWVNLLVSNDVSGGTATTITAAGTYSFSGAAIRGVRLRSTAYTSGTAVVTIQISSAGGGSGAGGGGSSSVSITQGGNTAAVNASSQLSVVCANCSGSGVSVLEDAASADGAAGTPAYSVRNDTITGATSTDGDYQPLKSDSAGRLYVTGTGGTWNVTNAGTFAVQAAATQTGTWTVQPGNTANTTAWLVAGGKTNNNAAPGATNFGVLGAVANAAAPSYTEGNQTALSMDLAGALRVGTHAVTQSGTWTMQPGNTANTTPWLFTIQQAGNSAAVNASGQLSVTCANCSGTGVSVNEDTASSNGAAGTPAYAVRQDTPATDTSADGDYTPLKSDSVGRLYVNCATGCSGSGTTATQDGALGTITSVTGPVPMARASAAAPTDVSADNDAVIPWYLRNGAQATVLTAAGALIGGDATNGIDVDVTRVTGTVVVAGGATPTDNMSNPTNAVTTYALMGCWDSAGSNWDRCPTSTGGSGTVDANTTRTTEATDSQLSTDVAAIKTAVQLIDDDQTGMSLTNAGVTSAASNNSTSVKGSAGRLMGLWLTNTTTTIQYLRLYNLASAPTCSSATGFIQSIPIPPAAAAGGTGGFSFNFGPTGLEFGTGIGYCITGGSSSTDNSNAAAGVFGFIGYK